MEGESTFYSSVEIGFKSAKNVVIFIFCVPIAPPPPPSYATGFSFCLPLHTKNLRNVQQDWDF